MRFIGVLLLIACNESSLYVQPEPDNEGDTTDSEPVIVDTVDTEETVGETDTAEPPIDEEPIATLPVYAHTRSDLYSIEPNSGERTWIGVFETPSGDLVDGMIDIAIDLDGRVFGATWDSLFRIDPETAEATWVCDTDEELYAMTFTSAGVLFGGAGERIVEIDINSCVANPLFSESEYSTSGDLVGLPDGFLYWTVRGDDEDMLVRVDPDNGDSEWIGNIGYKKLFGLGYDEDQLYGFSDEGKIVRIDPNDGDGTVLATDDSVKWWGATTNPVAW